MPSALRVRAPPSEAVCRQQSQNYLPTTARALPAALEVWAGCCLPPSWTPPLDSIRGLSFSKPGIYLPPTVRALSAALRGRAPLSGSGHVSQTQGSALRDRAMPVALSQGAALRARTLPAALVIALRGRPMLAALEVRISPSEAGRCLPPPESGRCLPASEAGPCLPLRNHDTALRAGPYLTPSESGDHSQRQGAACRHRC